MSVELERALELISARERDLSQIAGIDVVVVEPDTVCGADDVRELDIFFKLFGDAGVTALSVSIESADGVVGFAASLFFMFGHQADMVFLGHRVGLDK